MGSRLLCVPVRQIQNRLRRYGYTLERKVGSHEQWRCPRTGKNITVAVHGADIRGEQVKDIYERAGWALKVHRDKPRKRKKAAEAKAPAKISVRQTPPSPEQATTYKRFTLDERIAVVELAMAEGDAAAAARHGISLFCVTKWRGELGDADGSAPLREWKRRATEAEVVEAYAQRILAGESANRIAHSEQTSLTVLYSIAHGEHRNLKPETAKRLRARWAKRKSTNASGTGLLNSDTVAAMVDLIMEGVPVKHAAMRLGISENLGFRIACGRHRALNDAQRDRLLHRKSIQARPVNTGRDLRMEVERLQGLLAQERRTSAALRARLRGMASFVPDVLADDIPCLHGESLAAIEEVVTQEVNRTGRPRRDVQHRVGAAWVGEPCGRCGEAFSDLDTLMAQLWPG